MTDVNKFYAKQLIDDLRYLTLDKNYSIFNEHLFLPIDRAVSEKRTFFSTPDDQQAIARHAFMNIPDKVNEEYIEVSDSDEQSPKSKAIIKRYVTSAFGLLDFIPKLHASDIFIVGNRITYTDTNNMQPAIIQIPNSLLGVYNDVINRFINTTLQASDIEKTKFDRVYAIKDYEVDQVRFNVVHSSLSAKKDERPIISLRAQLIDFNRQTIAEATKFNENYIADQHLSDNQLRFINDLSTNGSFIIFGETGSGKTTLMKYMGNYNFELKRNLITIEDTAELFLPNDIAYLTNDNFTIRDLFKVSLRENPSHMLIGETRSEEIVDILESGLVYSCGTTLHADSFEKVIMRIIFLMKKHTAAYSTDDIEMLITSVIDGFIYMKNRQIQQIWKRNEEIHDMEDVRHNYSKVL